MKETNIFKAFFESEKAGGFVLIFATLISLLLANSIFQLEYIQIWNYKIGNHSIVEWINDGLMTLFFLLIGFELEREVYIGELSSFKKASLPLIGALGGMIVPALIYACFNYGTITQSGVGIPMATDIAFAIGILSLLGKRVPISLKIFLTALAVIDDLGAIIVIAIFYTSSISLLNLGIALGILGILFILNRLKVNNLFPYLIGGILMWYFMLNSGVHATITGVLLAFVIPFAFVLDCFVKKETVIGIIGKVHGIKIAKKPAPNAERNNHHLLSSEFEDSATFEFSSGIENENSA